MKLAVLVAVLLAACQAGDGAPPGPGGDAGPGDSGAGVPLTGRVCVLKDLRHLTDCDGNVDASSLTVSLGTRIATPSRLGEFTISAPLGAGFTWHVTGLNFIPSAMPFGTDNTIPVIGDVLYGELLNANSTTLTDQQGSIVVRVVRGVTPVAGVTATSTPVTNRLAFYDGAGLLDWDNDMNGTGPAGVVWFPDVPLAVSPPTLATLTLTPQGGTPVTATAAVENQAITFVTQDLP
jgi:hypothetical protein